jgi:hypothetical protein
MGQTDLLRWKLAIVLVVVVGAFVLAALGRISAPDMFQSLTSLAQALLLALGVSAAGSAVSAGTQSAARMRWNPPTPTHSPDDARKGFDR